MADVIYSNKVWGIRITKKRNPIQTTYQIHDHDLTVTKAEKYLEITISSNLSWNATSMPP